MTDQRLKSCFVISEIGEDSSPERVQADWVLGKIIRPATELAGYTAERADHIDRPGMITPDVIKSLMESNLVVADLSVQNPNVYYELAIAHAYGRPVVQIRHKGSILPFDVKDGRTVSFSRDYDDVEQARDQIVNQIRAVERDPADVDNPISLVVKILELSKSGTTEAIYLANILRAVEDLKGEVNRPISDAVLERLVGTLNEIDLLATQNSETASGIAMEAISAQYSDDIASALDRMGLLARQIKNELIHSAGWTRVGPPPAPKSARPIGK